MVSEVKRGWGVAFHPISSARRRMAAPASCAAASSSKTAMDRPLPVLGSEEVVHPMYSGDFRACLDDPGPVIGRHWLPYCDSGNHMNLQNGM